MRGLGEGHSAGSMQTGIGTRMKVSWLLDMQSMTERKLSQREDGKTTMQQSQDSETFVKRKYIESCFQLLNYALIFLGASGF